MESSGVRSDKRPDNAHNDIVITVDENQNLDRNSILPRKEETGGVSQEQNTENNQGQSDTHHDEALDNLLSELSQYAKDNKPINLLSVPGSNLDDSDVFLPDDSEDTTGGGIRGRTLSRISEASHHDLHEAVNVTNDESSTPEAISTKTQPFGSTAESNDPNDVSMESYYDYASESRTSSIASTISNFATTNGSETDSSVGYLASSSKNFRENVYYSQDSDIGETKSSDMFFNDLIISEMSAQEAVTEKPPEIVITEAPTSITTPQTPSSNEEESAPSYAKNGTIENEPVSIKSEEKSTEKVRKKLSSQQRKKNRMKNDPRYRLPDEKDSTKYRERLGSSSSLGSGHERKSSLKRKKSLPLIDLRRGVLDPDQNSNSKKSIKFASHVLVHGYQSDPDIHFVDEDESPASDLNAHPQGVLRFNSVPTRHGSLKKKSKLANKASTHVVLCKSQWDEIARSENISQGKTKVGSSSSAKSISNTNASGKQASDNVREDSKPVVFIVGSGSKKSRSRPSSVEILEAPKTGSRPTDDPELIPFPYIDDVDDNISPQEESRPLIESKGTRIGPVTEVEKSAGVKLDTENGSAEMFYVHEEGDVVTSSEGGAKLRANSEHSRARTVSETTTCSSEATMPSPGQLTGQDDGDEVFHVTDPTAATSQPGGNANQILPENLKTGLTLILSGLYGLLLVVLGFVVPIAETFADPTKPYMFEIFYLFLYGVSIAFLMYVYLYLLRKENLRLLSIPKSISRTFSRTFSKSSASKGDNKLPGRNSSEKSVGGAKMSPSRSGNTSVLLRQGSAMSFGSNRGRRRKIAYNADTSHHTGSFYLRVGIIGFGIGSMIHSGLTFGHYFEVNHGGDPCSDIIQAIKPFFHLCFTFIQMYFVFMNSKMCVHKYKTLARFGLVHMGGTNVCVWLRSIVVEALHVINMEERKLVAKAEQEYKDKLNESEVTPSVPYHEHGFRGSNVGSLPELNCHWDAMMGKIVEKSSVYLYPCTIEYSLVCAGVLFVMWSNVGEGYTKQRPKSLAIDSVSETDDGYDSSDDDNAAHKMSVDCAGSSQGLFMGILLFVASVVTLVCFYVLTSTPGHVTTASLMGHISEDVIYIVTLIATGIAGYQMKNLHFSTRREAGIEEILTLISLGGLGIYGMFSIVASIFNLDSIEGGLTIVTNILMLIQAGTQATFTLAALRLSAKDAVQVREKPGRQFVTFLLVSNFALWAINTFETQRLEHNMIQVEFYGYTAWSIFSHISVPLGIYFRFHSTVSLSNIWKKAWKLKHLPPRTH